MLLYNSCKNDAINVPSRLMLHIALSFVIISATNKNHYKELFQTFQIICGMFECTNICHLFKDDVKIY